MRVLLVGSEGSMGKRYQAIFKWLGIETMNVDKDTPSGRIFDWTPMADGIVICTPTDSHKHVLDILTQLKSEIPVLCEKPLATSKEDLDFIRSEIVKERKVNLTMVMQYGCLQSPGSWGDSWYDYFRHGNDGLYWDCLQIIGLAKGKVTLAQESPVWSCGLNGQKLNLSDMDVAYISFVKQWMAQPGDDISRLLDIHTKVMDYGKKH